MEEYVLYHTMMLCRCFGATSHDPPPESKKRSQFHTRLVILAAAGRIKGSRWHSQTAHHLALRWLPCIRG